MIRASEESTCAVKYGGSVDFYFIVAGGAGAVGIGDITAVNSSIIKRSAAYSHGIAVDEAVFAVAAYDCIKWYAAILPEASSGNFNCVV